MFETNAEKFGRFLDMAEGDLSICIDQRNELRRELDRTRAVLILAAGGRIEIHDAVLQNYSPRRTVIEQWRDEAKGVTVLTAKVPEHV